MHFIILFYVQKDVAHELAKIKLDRDWYKRDCENKERQIQEYHETLAQYKTQLETKIEEVITFMSAFH